MQPNDVESIYTLAKYMVCVVSMRKKTEWSTGE